MTQRSFTPQDAVLITGCGSGIGKALARSFHQRGLTVCATARRIDTIADLASEGMLTLPLDVCDPAQIDAVMNTLQARSKRVRMLINNAGYGAMGPLLDVPVDEWRRQFDINVFAPVALIQAVVPGMIGQRCGVIANVSSVSGVTPTPFASPYCASKAAVNALSDSLRMELAPFGVSVVTIQPGGIQSTFGESAGNRVNLAPGSPFEPVRDGVMARANEGQQNAMPANRFAELVAKDLLSPRCPAVIRHGEKSQLLPLLKRMLPDRMLDSILSRRFGLNRLAGRS
jgi:NAD(P)-dependent dehydrogenase (short-subunit alcohol dehydrogenase family)